jgi:dehydrogenase/reductase SDR family member 7B
MNNQQFYNGKVIWITGASSGIGEALAVKLASWNTRLILSSNQPEELDRVKASLPLKAEDLIVLPLDLGEPDSLAEKAKEALKAFGHIDILINNGGISQRSLVLETSMETIRKIFEIDFFSGVILTKSVLPAMVEYGLGYIASVSSITGKFGFPLRSAYSAAKHAMVGFYESLGAEYYDQGIRTTLVFPGRVRTNISLGALGPDGKSQGIMDHGQEYGITPEQCAMDILNGIRKNKREILSGGKELLMVYVKRFFPGLAFRLNRRIKPT